MVEVIGGALKKERDESVVDIDSGEEEEAEKVVKRRRKTCDPHKKRACMDCTKRCARIHGRAASSSSVPSSSNARSIPAVPSFFKVMMGYFSENMDIPTPFAKRIMALSGSNIYLEDAFGLRWRVRVCLRDGVLSFGHGWKNFVLDHAVSCGEFLVFRQIAKSVFTVQMFALSAVERLYLCERNKRQSRKRKPRQKTSSPSNRTGNMSKNNVESCKKKQRTRLRNDPGPRDCIMSVHVCIDDSDVPNSASELKCSEISEKVAAESQEISEVPTRHRSKAQKVLDGETSVATGQQPPKSMVVIGLSATPNTNDTTNMMIDDNESTHAHQDRSMQLHPALGLENENTEIENGEGSNLPTNVDATGPLAMMNLNEVSIDDIFLSADIYEFESDICNSEAFSVDLNMDGPITTVQNSDFNCIVDTSQNHHFSMGVDQRFVVSETLPCTENKQMTDALGIYAGAVNVPAHAIDVLPANEPSSFGVNSSLRSDAEVPSSECALTSGSKDRCAILFNSAAQKEELLRNNKASEFVPADSSVEQDQLQDGQVNMQDSAEHNVAEIMPSSSKPHELTQLRKNALQTGNKSNDSGDLKNGNSESGGVLALAANSRKFCITVPAPDQTWLELPSRLPVLPRTKKQGRKVVILKDPRTRLWPVLYQCTPRFSGFITGWVDISRENNLQEGDTCEFELSSNSELSFQVHMPNAQ